MGAASKWARGGRQTHLGTFNFWANPFLLIWDPFFMILRPRDPVVKPFQPISHSDFLPERIRVRIFRSLLADFFAPRPELSSLNRDFFDTGFVASSVRVPLSDSFLIGFRHCYCVSKTNAYATCAQLCCTSSFPCHHCHQDPSPGSNLPPRLVCMN